MLIQNCFNRGGGPECTSDALCILQPSTQPGVQNICVPANSPPVLSEPADISDPEIELLKRMIRSLSNIHLGDRLDNELRKMYPPLVYYVNRKIRSGVAGAANNIPWGTLADRLANTILNELQNTTCPICLNDLNDREDRSSVIYPICCNGQQVLHKKCFRETVESTQKCPSCRTVVTMEGLRDEEKAAEHLEISLLPFVPSLLRLSQDSFRHRVQRHVEQLNDMWEQVQQVQNPFRNKESLELRNNRSARRATVWALNTFGNSRGHAEHIELIDAEINRLVYESLLRRRSLGMATIGPSGSIELKNITVYLMFLIMGILGIHLIYDTDRDR